MAFIKKLYILTTSCFLQNKKIPINFRDKVNTKNRVQIMKVNCFNTQFCQKLENY